VKIKIHLNLI